MRDRLRGIQQDGHHQGLCNLGYTGIIEQSTRFSIPPQCLHFLTFLVILAGHRLCATPGFSKKQNNEQISNSLITLEDCCIFCLFAMLS